MPDAISILREFYNLCVEARSDFDLYRTMFEADPEGTKRCVDYAPYFFNDFGRIITRTLVLHVCRLTDPAKSLGQPNLTTNYILQELPWPDPVKARLAQFNDLLMAFRTQLNPARNKRVAHIDLHSQINRLDAMGQFDKGEDAKFFANLQSFYDVAHRHVHGDTPSPIAIAMSTEGHPRNWSGDAIRALPSLHTEPTCE
jgi:AbiU2